MAGLTAAAVAMTLLVVGGVVLAVTLREQSGEAGRLLSRATGDVDDVDRLPSDVAAWQRRPDGREQRSPDAPRWLPVRADVERVLLPGGPRVVERSVERAGSAYDLRTERRPDGIVVQAAWSGAAHRRETTRLVTAVLVAELVGLGLSVLVGVLVARRAMAPLELALARQRRFVADASHELRTPLTLLTTRAQLLERRLRHDGDTSHPQAEALVADARRMGDVVTDLLLAASLEAQPERGEPVDVRAIATAAVEAAQALAAESGVTVSGPQPGASATVLGTAGALRRVVDSLVDNASRHTPRGGSVEVAVTSGGGRVVLEVADDGPGIDPAVAGRLFERFAHAPAAENRSRSGFGLGLALVREVVEAHGGTVAGRDGPHGGAVFEVSLPSAG
jgi:signal transduction histidine kinase